MKDDLPRLPEEYNPDEIETPETHFKNLYAADETNSPLYNLWQGEVYEEIKYSENAEINQATRISQLLNNREIEQAQNLAEKVLEP